MSKRVDAVVGAAIQQSKVLLDAVPRDRETYRVNAERIIAVCKELVTTKPAQEPLTPVIAERGAVLFGKFPAGQSLLNRYGGILRIWRGAYRSIVDLSAPVPTKAATGMVILEEDLAGLDNGGKARMLVVMQMLREQKQENDRLRHLIREQIPAPRQNAAEQLPAPLAPQSLSALRAWLNTVVSSGGGLELDEVGVRISRHARPRQVVIPLEVIEALRALCDGVSEPPALLVTRS